MLRVRMQIELKLSDGESLAEICWRKNMIKLEAVRKVFDSCEKLTMVLFFFSPLFFFCIILLQPTLTFK